MIDLEVADDIRVAEGLPAAAFVEPAVLARELATIFARSWLIVPDRGGDDPRPLDEQVAARGTRVPITVAERPLFLQRGWDDEALRAFPNTCTHAWYPLVLGASRGPTLVCGQHGRRFDCAGRYVSHQGFTTELRACDHLTALPVAQWRRLTWVNLDPAAAPLARVLAPVDESLARFPALPERMSAEIRDVAGNWKQHAWNFLDHFHIGFVHRAPHGLADAIDLASYTVELHDHAVLQWVYARDPAAGIDPAWLPDRFAAGPATRGRRVFALWWFVFPNVALSFYPWGLSVNVYQPHPERPDTTRFGWYQFAFDRAAHAERDRRWLSAQIDAEDVETLAQVSRGLRSGFAPRPRFAPDEERAAHWFHRAVARALRS